MSHRVLVRNTGLSKTVELGPFSESVARGVAHRASHNDKNVAVGVVADPRDGEIIYWRGE